MAERQNPRVRTEDAVNEPGPKARHNPQYAVYKPTRGGKGGVLRFELNAETPAVFLETARQAPGDGAERRFDWPNKIIMKCGLSDIGELLAVFERRQPSAKLYHQTEKSNTALEMLYQSDRKPPNYMVSISRQESQTKDVNRVSVPVSSGEAAVLAALLRRAVVVLAGWH